jgi:integrase
MREIRPMKLLVNFPYVHRDRDRHGNLRLYFRRRMGEPKIRLRNEPGTAKFAAEYDVARHDAETEHISMPGHRVARAKVGTLWWLCVGYFRSQEFARLDERTQRTRRGILENALREPIAPGTEETFADFPINRLTTRTLRILRDRKALLPEAANNRVKAIRRVFAWALEQDLIENDPSRDVKRIKNATEGYHAWTIEEVQAFERQHVMGSKARLALALLLYTGVRRSDVVLLGERHIHGGWFKIEVQKNRNRKPVTVELPVLPALREVLDVTPTGSMTFLVTEYGKPFTHAGFGNWFRKRCDEAGLTRCTPHGLRKAGAVRAAENGATAHELMAIFGWLSLQEAERYTRAAQRKHLARNALHLLERRDAEA